MKLFITGIGGFLGSRLRDHWRKDGHSVTGSERRAGPPGVFAPGQSKPFDAAWLDGVDVLVHCAYDKDASYEESVESTKLVAAAAQHARVGRQVFFSSYSARPGAGSLYGRIKYELEVYFLERGHTIVRPGLVAGNGGLFGRNMAQILRSPVMPLVDGGNDLLPIIGIGDLVEALAAIVESGGPGAYNLFYDDLMPMRSFIEMINRKGRHKALYVPIPAGLAASLLEFVKKIGIPIPVDTGNLRALKENQAPIHRSDLNRLLTRHSTNEEAICSAVAEYLARS